jgi:hypothetical protein
MHAWRERKRWTDLGSFLRENGGPAGCAERFAAINPRGKYPGCIVYRRPETGRPYLIVQKEPGRVCPQFTARRGSPRRSGRPEQDIAQKQPSHWP